MRTYLKFVGILASGLIVAGCSVGPKPPMPPSDEATSSSASQSDESSSAQSDANNEDSTSTQSSTDADGSNADGSNADDSNADGSTAKGSGSDSKTTPAKADLADVTFTVTAEKALEISADKVGESGVVHAIEVDYSESNDAWVWSVKTLVNNQDHKVEINADTGDVIKAKSEETDDSEKAIDLTSPMTWDEAKKLALDAVSGPIRGWKLEWDDGATQYEFDIGTNGRHTTEVSVDVDTSNVTVDD